MLLRSHLGVRALHATEHAVARERDVRFYHGGACPVVHWDKRHGGAEDLVGLLVDGLALGRIVLQQTGVGQLIEVGVLPVREVEIGLGMEEQVVPVVGVLVVREPAAAEDARLFRPRR